MPDADTPATKPTIEFWFGFGSNYSYISTMRIEAAASRSGLQVRWRPFLLGPIFRSFGWESSPFVLQAAKGEVFDPWLVDLFTEVVEKDPPQPFDREVMIVPGGVMPWRDVAHDAEHDDVEDADAELEVMLDDFPFEEKS